MNAEIVTIGRELLDGSRSDTNTVYLGSRLWALGTEVVRSTTVPDEPAAIEDAVGRALEAADIVITTGGLGPTSDDRTKHVVARLFARKLVLDEDVLARLYAYFEELGREMPEINMSQAMIPEGARVIMNTRGTAPGLVLEKDDAVLFSLPGVPSEMRAMVENYVVPFLEGRGLVRLVQERVIRTTGIPESTVAERTGDLARKLIRTEVAYLPSMTGVDLKVVARGDTPAEAARTADRSAERLADRLGSYVYARGGESIEKVVGYLLAMGEATLAVAESCTGGRLGWRVTKVPGSSDYFLGGVVAYADELKKRLLGVKAGTLKRHGAVSAEVASEMAAGVRKKTGASYALSITGTAGPGGGTAEKPVGLVYVGVAWERGERVSEFRFPGGRGQVRERAAQAALDSLRRVLLNIEAP